MKLKKNKIITIMDLEEETKPFPHLLRFSMYTQYSGPFMKHFEHEII